MKGQPKVIALKAGHFLKLGKEFFEISRVTPEAIFLNNGTTDYSKDSDFANMLFNKAEDQSAPAYCDKGYVVVVLENNVELKFWYQELHDAMRWLWSVTVELATEPFEALRIDSFDGQWILS